MGLSDVYHLDDLKNTLLFQGWIHEMTPAMGVEG